MNIHICCYHIPGGKYIPDNVSKYLIIKYTNNNIEDIDKCR